MFSRALILALSLATPAAAYTKKDREDAIKWITEEKGFPHLAAFDKMTPKMLKTVMTNYLNLVSPDALEFLTPLDLEVIWTATSAANNCEICLSFHAGALLGAEKPADEVATMAAGGVPKDPKMARLVMAAKYVLAHKGILLEREKLHLSSMGFSAEELVEVTFAVGQMAGLNLLYVAPRPRSSRHRRRFTHTGTSTSSARASRSRRSSRARARSRTRSTRTSSRRPSFDHFILSVPPPPSS